MARSLWSGFLGFGLVNVPVGLYSATRDLTIHFNQLHKGTSNRIRYRKVDETTGEEVEASDIVNGYDLGGGEYVVVTKEELKEAAPGRSELIEIQDFVDLSRIDPRYFRQTYYLAPRGKGADRAYALLRQAMRETNRIGIATLVLRDKEYLVAIRPDEEVLILETMYFADEIRSPRAELESLPDAHDFEGRELDIAKQLIESLSAEWKPDQYSSSYRGRVEDLIERKREGRAVVFHAEAPKSNVIDLMAALEASVARSGAAAPAASTQAVAEKPEPSRGAKASDAALTATPPTNEQQRFEGMTKAELLEQASRIDLQGRSKMSKAELVDALSAQAPARSRRRRAS